MADELKFVDEDEPVSVQAENTAEEPAEEPAETAGVQDQDIPEPEEDGECPDSLEELMDEAAQDISGPAEEPQEPETKRPAPEKRPNRSVVDNTEYFVPRDDRERELARKWNNLRGKFRRKEIVAARIISADPDSLTGMHFNLLLDNDFPVVIDDKHFFTEGAFKADYYTAPQSEQIIRRLQKGRECTDAWISFIIAGMPEPYRDEDGKMVYGIVGDRLTAMKMKQQKYFFGKKPVQEGDDCEAEVISVGEHYANLELLGVECSIRTSEITAFKYVQDCRDVLKSGDRLHVRIRKIHLNADGTVRMNVSGAAYEYRQMVDRAAKLVVGSSHSGTVKSVNNEIYSVVLDCGAIVAVNMRSVVGNVLLMPGDRVSVTIVNKTARMTWGTAKKK